MFAALRKVKVFYYIILILQELAKPKIFKTKSLIMNFLNDAFASLSGRVGNILPGVLGALLVLIIGLFLAGIIKRLVRGIMNKTTIDEQLAEKMNMNISIADFIAKMVYYLVVIYTLIMVLDMMGVSGVLEPLQNMLNQFLGFIPNLIAAGIIAFAGYIIANIASEATGFLSNSVESFAAKSGIQSGIDLSKIIKQLVFIFVFLPILIVSLDTLGMEAISGPATEMLGTFLNAIPNILAAAITIGVFFIAGKFITGMLTDLMQNIGVDDFSQKLGVANMVGNSSLSKMIGSAVFFFIVFAGVIAGVDRLGFGGSFGTILNDIFSIAGRVFFGMIILAAGSFAANLAGDTLAKGDSAWMASIAKIAVMAIFLAFGLSTMGIAENIVNMAFGLTLGAAAVAFALAFGLGGREAAGKQLEKFFDNMNK